MLTCMLVQYGDSLRHTVYSSIRIFISIYFKSHIFWGKTITPWTEMRFATIIGFIALLLQFMGNLLFFYISHHIGTLHFNSLGHMYAKFTWTSSCKHTDPRREAYRIYSISPVKTNALSQQPIYIRGVDIGVTHT